MSPKTFFVLLMLTLFVSIRVAKSPWSKDWTLKWVGTFWLLLLSGIGFVWSEPNREMNRVRLVMQVIVQSLEYHWICTMRWSETSHHRVRLLCKLMQKCWGIKSGASLCRLCNVPKFVNPLSSSFSSLHCDHHYNWHHCMFKFVDEWLNKMQDWEGEMCQSAEVHQNAFSANFVSRLRADVGYLNLEINLILVCSTLIEFVLLLYIHFWHLILDIPINRGPTKCILGQFWIKVACRCGHSEPL